MFKLYVDSEGDDDYLPLANSPSIRIHGATADAIVVNAPAEAVAGQPVLVTAWLRDKFANPATGFTGTLRLESDDPKIQLPSPYKFSAGDASRHRFEGIVFPNPGTYRLRVIQTDASLRGASGPIRVHANLPEQRVYWGDIHTHTS